VRERFSSSVHRGDACVRHRLVAGSIGVGSVERSKRPKSEHIHLSATRSAHFTAFARYDKCIWMQGRKCIHDMVMDNRGGGGPMQRARSLQRALSSINGRASSPLTKLSHFHDHINFQHLKDPSPHQDANLAQCPVYVGYCKRHCHSNTRADNMRMSLRPLS
jgi:hypothetical protein